jgi:hypothetical protein
MVYGNAKNMTEKLFTCITLSKEPLTRKVPDNCLLYNSVQTFTQKNTIHNYRLKSVEEVTTPYFFVCDSDDPMPDVLHIPDKAIMYGDIYIIKDGVEKIIETGDWSHSKNMNCVQFLHKPICNTHIAKRIIKILPKGNYNTDFMLYYCLALIGGFTYNKNVIHKWVKHKTGIHKTDRTGVVNSVKWINDNLETLKLLKFS